MREQPWIKVWQEKILSSQNLRELNFTSHSLFLQLLIRVRPSGKLQGMLVYPKGKPVANEKLAKDMKLKLCLFNNALQDLLDRDIVENQTFIAKDKQIYPLLYLRKFEDLQKRNRIDGVTTVLPEDAPAPSQGCNNTGTTQNQPLDTKGVTTSETPKRESKNDMKKNNKNSIYQSLFNYWNLQEIANHRKLTNKMKRSINGRLDEGFTEAEIMRAIANYAKILKSEEYWWTHRWTALIDFLNRGIDKFKDWNIAHINYLQSDKKLAGLKDKKEEQFEASLHKIITDCKKCDGKGSIPVEDGTRECSCRKRVKELRKEHKAG